MKRTRNLTYIVLINLTLIVCYFLSFYIAFSVAQNAADYENYFDNFYGVGGERFGIGYVSIVLLFQSIGIDVFEYYRFFILFLALSIKTYVIYKINRLYFLTFLFLYLPSFFILHDIVQIRLSLAFIFVFLYLLSLYRGYVWIGLPLLIIAALFHSSFLIFFLLPVIYLSLKYGFVKSLYAFLSVLLFYIFFIFDPMILSIFNPLVEKYIEWNTDVFRFNSVSMILNYAMVIGLFLTLKYATNLGKVIFHFYIAIFLIALALYQVPVLTIRLMDLIAVLGLIYVVLFNFKIVPSVIYLFAVAILIALHRFMSFVFVFPIV